MRAPAPLPLLPEGESYYVLAEFHGTRGAYNIDTAHRHCSGARQALFLVGGARYVEIAHEMVRGGILLPPVGMPTYGTPFSARTRHGAETRASRAWRAVVSRRPARVVPRVRLAWVQPPRADPAHTSRTRGRRGTMSPTQNTASKEYTWEV